MFYGFILAAVDVFIIYIFYGIPYNLIMHNILAINILCMDFRIYLYLILVTMLMYVRTIGGSNFSKKNLGPLGAYQICIKDFGKKN